MDLAPKYLTPLNFLLEMRIRPTIRTSLPAKTDNIIHLSSQAISQYFLLLQFSCSDNFWAAFKILKGSSPDTCPLQYLNILTRPILFSQVYQRMLHIIMVFLDTARKVLFYKHHLRRKPNQPIFTINSCNKRDTCMSAELAGGIFAKVKNNSRSLRSLTFS